jgi:hypothetical protein
MFVRLRMLQHGNLPGKVTTQRVGKSSEAQAQPRSSLLWVDLSTRTRQDREPGFLSESARFRLVAAFFIVLFILH